MAWLKSAIGMAGNIQVNREVLEFVASTSKRNFSWSFWLNTSFILHFSDRCIYTVYIFVFFSRAGSRSKPYLWQATVFFFFFLGDFYVIESHGKVSLLFHESSFVMVVIRENHLFESIVLVAELYATWTRRILHAHHLIIERDSVMMVAGI